ncbi:phage tail protein [Paenibacillus sp. MBLB4367]|uniref:phage tail protein n=1 Tax=Paenibacillus sp. MBLB4367 TaxID=3384767 RepID=UPI00390819B1
MEPFLGEIRLFAFGFTPRGWLPCEGQILSIQANTALFSLLGVTYGGNGVTNFGLPNLQGRVPLHVGASRSLGTRGGEERHTLTTVEIPAHTHTARASTSTANDADPAGKAWAALPVSGYMRNAAPNTVMNPQAVASTGGSQPHNNMQPYTVLNFCIAITGIYPTRN